MLGMLFLPQQRQRWMFTLLNALLPTLTLLKLKLKLPQALATTSHAAVTIPLARAYYSFIISYPQLDSQID